MSIDNRLRSVAPGRPTPPPPARPPEPIECITKTDVQNVIESLEASTKELVGFESNIIQRLEDQVALLMQQAGAFASISLSLHNSTTPNSALGQSYDEANHALKKLRDNLCVEIKGMHREIDDRLEHSAAALGRNSEILASLCRDLVGDKPTRSGPFMKAKEVQRESRTRTGTGVMLPIRYCGCEMLPEGQRSSGL